MNESDSLDETVFLAARQLENPAERAAYLAQACGANQDLRQRVERLLQAGDRAKRFFGKRAAEPAVEAAATLWTEPLSEKPGDVIGHYKLLEALGEGGFGSVWLAEQKEPVRRKAALKVIKLGMDTKQVVARFEAERQALALMDHPNVAKILDAGTTDSGRPYFVMELVRGIPITRFCDENKLTPRERLDLFIKVCHAIQHAHQKGIIHRDLKPSNVLVTLHDGVPVPKVIDFGIAKATQQELTDKTLHTMFQQFMGTPAYVSPEQAEMSGLDVDTRSDIYSLGVLLYELLTGKTPFDGKELLASGLDEMRRAIREKEPLRPSTRLAMLSDAEQTTAASRRATEPAKLVHLLRGDVDWIVMKCLEKDRTRRYETANGLARDIERHLNHEPVTARPPSTAYRVRKFVRRNQVLVTATATVVAVLMVAALVSTWQAMVAIRAGRLADEAKLQAVRAGQNEAAERQKAVLARNQAQEAQQRAVQNLSIAQANELRARRLLYDTDINLAQRALQSKHLGLARRLLARHVPVGGIGRSSLPEPFSFGPEDVPAPAGHATNDLRDWEWRYLWHQCQSPAVRLCKLQQGITGLSFATNGDWIAVTLLGGRRAELWSRLKGQRLQILTTNGCGAAQNWRTAFSPVAALMAIGLANGAVLVTNFDTGAHWSLQTGALLSDPKMMADKLAFSPDGRHLAALGGHWWGTTNRGTVFVWETEKFTLVSTNTTSAPIGDSYAQGGLGWMPNSDWLWIGAMDSSIEETPALGGPPVRRAIAGKGGLALAISPAGDTLATSAGWTGLVQVWDIRSGKPLAAPRRLAGHTAFVSCLAYSPDGRWLASASADQTILLWDQTTWQSIELRGHSEEVHALAFTPDSLVLASGSRDGEVLLWRLDSGLVLQEHQQLTGNVEDAVIAPGSHQLLAKMTDRTLALIDTRTLAKSPLPFAAGESQIWPSGLAVTADRSNRLTFIEVKEAGYHVLGQTEGIPRVLEHSPVLQDRVFAFVSGSNTVTCVPLDNVSRRFQLSAGPGVTQVNSLAFRGRQLFGYDQDGGILFWDLQEQRLLRRVAIRGIDVLWQPELPDLVVFNRNDLDKPAFEFRDFAHPEKVLSRHVIPYSIHGNQAFSPDHQLLAVSIQDTGSLLLFDLPSRTLKRSLQRHLMSVRAPTFSPDGRRLASAGGFVDNVKLWDVETGQELLSLATESALNSYVQFSDDGNLILGQYWYLWRAPSWEEIRLAEEALIKQPASLTKEVAAPEREKRATANRPTTEPKPRAEPGQ